MQNIKYLFILALIFTNYSCETELFGCLDAEGEIVLQTIQLPTISKIDLNISGEIIIKEGESQEIQIEASQNVIERIISDSEVGSDKWEINIDGCYNVTDVKIFATLLSLESLNISGSGSISTEGVFANIDKINLEIDGEGHMDIQLAAVEKVDIEINGSGTINVSGKCQEESVDINGDGLINAFDLESDNCRVEISGQGSVDIRAENLLSVELKGSGTVCYKGNPTLNIDISGSGEVNNCN